MRWFDRWFARMSKRAWEMERRDGIARPYPINTISVTEDRSLNSRNSLNFRILPATGGSVLEIQRYDDKRDRHESDLYLIDDNGDLAEQLASILVQHRLKN